VTPTERIIEILHEGLRLSNENGDLSDQEYDDTQSFIIDLETREALR
jgi:hypothetical protein